MKTSDKDETNWLDWAGLELGPIDELQEKARSIGAPVFKHDTEKDLYDRILGVEALKSNQSTAKFNKCMAAISAACALISIAVSVFG